MITINLEAPFALLTDPELPQEPQQNVPAINNNGGSSSSNGGGNVDHNDFTDGEPGKTTTASVTITQGKYHNQIPSFAEFCKKISLCFKMFYFFRFT